MSDVNQRWSSSRPCGSTYPSSFSTSITWCCASRRVVMVPSAPVRSVAMLREGLRIEMMQLSLEEPSGAEQFKP